MSSSIVIAVRALSGDGEEDDGGAAHGAHPQPNVAVPRSGDDPALLPAEPSGYAHFQLPTFLPWQERTNSLPLVRHRCTPQLS